MVLKSNLKFNGDGVKLVTHKENLSISVEKEPGKVLFGAEKWCVGNVHKTEGMVKSGRFRNG